MKIQQLRILINQSYKVFNTYGKTEVDVNENVPVFMEVLKPYSIDKITMAFKIWLDEETRLPTPADIKRTIIQWKPLDPYKPPEGRTHFPTDDEIENVSKMVKDLVDGVEAEKEAQREQRNSQPNTAHFDSQTQEQQDHCISQLKAARDKLISGEVKHGTET